MSFFTKLVSVLPLLAAFPLVARAEGIGHLPDAPPSASTESIIKAPGLPGLHVGPVKIGAQFVKRPRVDNQTTLKDVGFGLKFSLAI